MSLANKQFPRFPTDSKMNVLGRPGLSVGELSALAMKCTIQKAAYKLGLGITGLKAECRRLNIKQWPYRSITATRNMLTAPNISSQNVERIKSLLLMFETDPLGTDISPQWLMDLRRQVLTQKRTACCGAKPRQLQSPLAVPAQSLSYLCWPPARAHAGNGAESWAGEAVVMRVLSVDVLFAPGGVRKTWNNYNRRLALVRAVT
jgi:hypothetical protein